MSDPLMDLISGSGAASPDPLLSIAGRVENKYADNEGVKIHYAALGEGPFRRGAAHLEPHIHAHHANRVQRNPPGARLPRAS